VVNKYVRAHAAVLGGADAVVEIPTAFATGNAEIFAKAATQIAASFPHVSYLVFGTESKDLKVLKAIATAQINRKKDFEKYIKHHIRLGLSYDNSRCEVIKKLLPNIPADVIVSTLKMPNNILAVEYLKELSRLKSPIKAVNVMRVSNNYTDLQLTGPISSATAIRNNLNKKSENETFALDNYVPKNTLSVISGALEYGPDFELFGSAALYSVYTKMNADETYNCNPEIKNLISNVHPVTYNELKEKVPTRRFSVSRIARLALHSTLEVTKKDIAFLYKYNSVPYTNLLAINEDCGTLFAALCLNSKTPLVVRGNKIKPKQTEYTKRLQLIDEKAETLYETVCKTKFPNKTVFVDSVTNDKSVQ
jgi:predicted nucleotidyltransferase